MIPGSELISRKRAERIDVQLARKALSAVLPVRHRVGEWQSKAARLRAALAHGRTDADRTKVAAEARDLLNEVHTERMLLTHRAAQLPPEVTRDSHFQDMVRAIDTVAANVTQLAGPLAEGIAADNNERSRIVDLAAAEQPGHAGV